jgi:maleate isomerase
VLSCKDMYLGHQKFVGFITPSGNTIVERVTLGILRHFPEVSPHFSRTPVFGALDPFPDDYDWDSMLEAARLLRHADLSVITWNGSKGANIGLDKDRVLVDRITEMTGVASTTSLLAVEQVFREDAVKSYALVSPYREAYAKRIEANIEAAGFNCISNQHAGLSDNLSYASIPLDTVAEMMRSAAKSRPQAILSCCTNFPGAIIIAEMEEELGIPIYDTASIAVWKTLSLASVDTKPGLPWGSVFSR